MQETGVESLVWIYSLEEEMVNPFQYSCLKNPMNRGAWRATIHRVTKNQTRLNATQHNTVLYLACDWHHELFCHVESFTTSTVGTSPTTNRPEGAVLQKNEE